MRIGANARIDVANLAWASVFPTSVAGNVLWLRADAGVTLSSASVSSDTTEATNAWTKVLCTRVDGQTDPAGATSAIKLTDTVDGAPAVHYITRTPTNLVDGPHLFEFWAKAGTLNYIRIRYGGTASAIYIDLQNAIASEVSSGVVRGTLLSGTAGGWQNWRVEFSTTSATTAITMQLAQTGTGSGSNYQGDGTGTVFIGTGATYGPRLYQDRVSAWADRSGNANNATQGTAASQWIYQETDGSGVWIPTGQGGTPRLGNSADAEKRMDLPAGFYNLFTGDSTPQTVITVFRRLGTPAAGTFGVLRFSGAGTARRDTMQLTTANKFTEVHVADDAGAASYLTNTTTGTSRASAAQVLTSGTATSSIYLDGVADSLNPRAADVNTQTWNASNINARFRVYHEIAVFSSALSDPDRKRVENGMRARWGLNPL